MRLNALLCEAIAPAKLKSIIADARRLTSRDLQLYTSTPGHTAIGRDIAHELVKALQLANYKAARDHMFSILDKYRKYGAFDTEPREVILDILEKAFDHNRYD